MKLVIDIPEEEYELVRHADEFPMEVLRNLLNAIIKGTPLPKGHGRLIDADSMKTMKNIQSANFNAVELIRLWIDNQPTIIEGSDSE